MTAFTCRFCQKEVTASSLWCRFCQRVLMKEFARDCPNCGEAILRWSRFCRFCDARLSIEPPRNDDNFGGVAAKLPSGPPEGPSYEAYLTSAMPSPPEV